MYVCVYWVLANAKERLHVFINLNIHVLPESPAAQDVCQ